jgi:two-component system response regulator MprA
LLRSALAPADGVQTATAGRVFDALDSQQPELLVLDEPSLGCLATLAVCRDVRRANQLLPILYLSGRGGAAEEVVALDCGADSYVVLPCVPDLLLARVRALLRRQGPRSAEVLRLADLMLDTGQRSVWRGARQVHLTATEYALLSLFLRSPERVLTRGDLIERVWGHGYSGNLGVLDVYLCYLRNKLEAGGEPRLIHTVRGIGYILRVEAPARQRWVASAVPRRPKAAAKPTPIGTA